MEGDKSKAIPFPQQNTEEDDLFSSDSIYLRNLVPEEIWKLITEKLLNGSPSDNPKSLANSSLFFRKLLARQRTNYLFENAFLLVPPTIWKKEGLEGFPVSDLFNCREVCSKWSSSIDKLISQKFQHFGKGTCNNQLESIGETFGTLLENNMFTNYTNWNSEKSVERFLRHFERSHPPPPSYQSSSRNPLIWGELTVAIITPDDTNDEELERYDVYLEDVSSVLYKYGSYLHKFSVYIDKHNNFEEASTLQEWFSYLSNVKSLEFESDWWGNAILDLDYYHDENFIFPKLKNLETLEIKGLPDPVFNRLILHNSQISSLILSWWYEEYRFYTFPLPNLKMLDIEFATPDILDRLDSPQIQWPLESLKLTIDEYDEIIFVEFARLFRVIENKFGGTLVCLDLNLYVNNEEAKDTLEKNCKNGQLYLPNLKIIKLYMGKALVMLDFLLRMKHNLEKIEVHVGYKYPAEERDIELSGTTVQFIGFEDKMLESNVWTIFEKLNIFEVSACWAGLQYSQQRLYFRKDWMRNNKLGCA